MDRPLVTFTSDFGLQDWFVGVVHGAIHAVCPDARVVDVSHAVPPGAVARGAFILQTAAPDFPAGTVHLAVVDPGVGTGRRALAVRARGQWFVGPDNGLLEHALAAPDAVVHALTESRWFHRDVSLTFHARDIFAPCAAHLAAGVAAESMGPRVTDARRLPLAAVRFQSGTLHGRVVFVDRFGNALTDLLADEIARRFPAAGDAGLEVSVGGRRIRGLVRAYGDSPVGTLVAIVGSSGALEIAQVGGHVTERLGLGEGDPVQVRTAE
jgi:S-adenosyl-L-methionine hydrolase (adenosine-forming)